MKHSPAPQSGRHEGLWYEVRGAGEWMVLLHGFPSSSDDWDLAAKTLQGTARVLRIDLLGYGRSAKPRGADYSVRAHVDRLLDLLAYLGIQSTRLVGHDLGGILVQQLVYRAALGHCRLQIVGVAILNISLYHRDYRPTSIQRLLAIPPLGKLLVHLLSRRSFEHSLRSVWGQEPPSAPVLDRLWRRFTHENGHLLTAKHLRYIAERAANGDAWMEKVEAFKGPMLLIWGVEDPVSGPSVLAIARQRIPWAVVVELPCGHYPQIEQPQRVAEALRDWALIA